MTENLDPKTVDLIGVLSGRDYPEIEIAVYFNEKLGFAINEMRKMLRSAEVLNQVESAEALHEEIQALVQKTTSEQYTLKLRAIPEKIYRQITLKVQEEFPDKLDFLQRPTPNPEGDEAFTRYLWEAYLITISDAEGTSRAITPEDVSLIIDEAPRTVHEQINAAISELRTGAKAGFEYAAKELDFLSQASPEG